MGRKKQRVRWNPVDTTTPQQENDEKTAAAMEVMEQDMTSKMETNKDVNSCETVSNPGSTHSVTHSHTSSNHSSGYRPSYYRGYSGGPAGGNPSPVAKDRTHYHNGPPPPPPHRRYNSNGDRSQGGSPWVAPLAPRYYLKSYILQYVMLNNFQKDFIGFSSF